VRLRAGDPEDYEAAFRGLYIQAFRVGERITGSPHDAEDVASEAMATTLRRWSAVRDLPHLEPWVKRVAANLAIDLIRKRPRPVAVPFRDVDDAFARAEEHADLAQLLARLPRRQREVLTLRYLVGLGEADVARLLRVSVGSVKRHASRGTSALRQKLRPSDPNLEVSVVVL